MKIQVTVDDEVAECAREKAEDIGITLEQAIQTYLFHVAEGAELVENESLPDSALRRRTLRQQTYRL